MKLTKVNENAQAPAFLSFGVEAAGEIHFAEELQIEGKVNGKLVSANGVLVIQERGRVEAQVKVGVCIIRGTVNGNVSATSRIEIYKTGRVTGELTTPVLLVEEGAVINGTVGMENAASRHQVNEPQAGSSQEKSQIQSA